ncbi:MAG: NACHT domain-containing protein, partial [Armatimonadetes bacterium]|nr:NACHT domain-containing protein [Armatimonadota bacterium]
MSSAGHEYSFSPRLEDGREIQYRLLIHRSFNEVQMLGLRHFGDEAPLRLAQIYTQQPLVRQQGDPEGSRFFLPHLLRRSRHGVVRGDPGSGKSTLMRFVAISFSDLEGSPLAQRLGPLLPIPVVLREYRDIAKWRNAEEMLAAYVRRLYAAYTHVPPGLEPAWLLAALRQGRGFLVLDGLDEVGSLPARRNLRRLVADLLPEMKESYCLLTSRIVGYEEVPFHALLDEPL